MEDLINHQSRLMKDINENYKEMLEVVSKTEMNAVLLEKIKNLNLTIEEMKSDINSIIINTNIITNEDDEKSKERIYTNNMKEVFLPYMLVYSCSWPPENLG